ncbi:MAG: hypothetical protein H7Y60_09115 [Rhodospirillaceae bacterium]|nr:hypothetical protein [Rhodospirillales bacterium]
MASRSDLTDKMDSFREAVEPLVKWLNENGNPHTKIIVDQTSAELVEGVMCHRTEAYLKD